jgi:hypothetical protein
MDYAITGLAKEPAAPMLSPLAGNTARRKSIACGSVAVLALALAPLPAFAARATGTASIVPANPVANVVANPNYDDCSANGLCGEGQPCYTASYAPAFASPACEQDELEAIDNARAKEGVGPMYLPRDYNSLSGDEQLLVVIDLERVGRGLPAFAGIVASSDGVAQQGAQVNGQPAGTFEDPSLPSPFTVGPGTAFAYNCQPDSAGSDACEGSGNPGASIAAGGQISALDADYGWMYNDGYGGSNSDCETPQAQGCWGHRDNILGAYPTHTRYISKTSGSPLSTVPRRTAVPVMGAGSLQPNGGGPQGNWTAIFASVTGRTPAFVYSWNQALADGAGQHLGSAGALLMRTARYPVGRIG